MRIRFESAAIVASLFVMLQTPVIAGVSLCNGEANGTLDGDEQCETGPCCSPACELLPAITVCRASADLACDIGEACGEQEPAVEAACPVDLHEADETPCDDGDACTTADVCSGGVCAGIGECATTTTTMQPTTTLDGVTTTTLGATTTTVLDATTTTLAEATTTTVPEPATTLPDTTTTTVAAVTTTTMLDCPVCGDANGDCEITATDALLILQAAVDLRECILEICDFTGDGRILAIDALAVLRMSVGLPSNPRCPGTTTTLPGETTTTLSGITTTTLADVTTTIPDVTTTLLAVTTTLVDVTTTFPDVTTTQQPEN